jgi:hypothetical protein
MENEILKKEILKLREENEDLKSKLIDLTFEQNYSIEKELAEIVRELYSGVCEELKNKKSELTKKQILENIRNNLQEFAKNYKFKL